jgi:hypothetical protein
MARALNGHKPSRAAVALTASKREERAEAKTLATVMAATGSGLDNGFTPLMPRNLVVGNFLADLFGKKTGPERFAQARRLAKWIDFFATVIYLKETFFNDGFSFGESRPGFTGGDAKLKRWLDAQVTAGGQPYDFSQIVNDAWGDWLVYDNAIAFWTEPENVQRPTLNAQRPTGEGLPRVIMLDPEACEYTNAFGVERLKIRLEKVTLKPEDEADLRKRGMPERYIKALKEGKPFLVDPEEGDHFRVLSRAKLGKGLGDPRISSILEQLSTMELFGLGDWAGASQMKKVVRQFIKGHEIKQGPLAGQPTHFLKVKEQKLIHNAFKDKDGAFDAVTNFDLAVKYPFLDPKFFDHNKMSGTLNRLTQWAGGLFLLFREGQVSPYAMEVFSAEGRAERSKMSKFLASIFADESFIGGATKAPPAELVPQWSPWTFFTQKMMNELVRLGISNGIMSGPSAREAMGLDDKIEGDRIEASRKKKERYTPVFEAKQGMGLSQTGGSGGGKNPGGRPTPQPTDPIQET